MLRPTGDRDGPAQHPPPGSSGAGLTDEPAAIVDLIDEQDIDPSVRALARSIASRLSVPRPPVTRVRRRGRGRPVTVPYRGGVDDLDLDRTLDVLAERPFPDPEDLFVREPVRAPRAVVLAVDLSGSMRGERVRTAAATVGALAAELERDALGVIAFWSDAAIVLRPGEPIKPMELLDLLLRIPAKGLTNVGFPLQLASGLLGGFPERDARVLLLSDCVHNAGLDPRPFAARLPRVDVLLDASGERDVDMGKHIARHGRGMLRVVRHFGHVAPALSDIFAPIS